jgi:hypothetical protein
LVAQINFDFDVNFNFKNYALSL